MTEAGAAAAEALAERLAQIGPDAVYSSPYVRAVSTVEPYARRAGLPVVVEARLKERVLADPERDDWLDHVRRSFEDHHHRAPGGESQAEVRARALPALADIAGAGHRLPVAASHGGLISAVLGTMDPTFGFEGWRSLKNPDLFELTFDGGRPVSFVRLD